MNWNILFESEDEIFYELGRTEVKLNLSRKRSYYNGFALTRVEKYQNTLLAIFDRYKSALIEFFDRGTLEEKMEFIESEDGIPYNKLTLLFFDCDFEGEVELVLVGRADNNSITEGIYKIKPIDGFLNGFEGVFGVLTHKDFGEKPFFTNEGFVEIKNLKNEHIQGFLDITLLNSNGKRIRISDSFQNF